MSCLEAEIHAFEVWRPPSWIFPLPVWSHSILMSPNGKLDPENIGIAVGISLIFSRLGAEIHALEVKRPPSWIFPLPVLSHSIRKAGPQKRRFRFWNFCYILCCPVWKRRYTHLKFVGRHLGFFHFRLSHTVSASIPMERWNQNSGNAVGFSLISCLRVEIQRLLSRFFGKFYNFRFGGRHIGIMDDVGHARFVLSHSPDIFRKRHQGISVY